MRPSLRRLRAVVALTLGTVGAGAVAWLLARTATSSWLALHRPAPDPDNALAFVAALGGLAICLWLGAGATLTAATVGMRRTAAGTSWLVRTAEAMTPQLVRRAVVVAVGVSLAAAAAPAHAAAGGSGISLDPSWGGASAAGPSSGLPPSGTGVAGSWARHPSAISGGATVVVRAGDTLWALAAAHLPAGASHAEIARAWPAWFAANRQVIGKDPDALRPGQRLHVPG